MSASTVAPNPFSPFADADPKLRHLFPVPFLFATAPRAGTLAPTGCNRLAVVPESVADAPALDALPGGLCPVCVATMRDDDLPADEREASACTGCGITTRHGHLCALCRGELHDAWWPTHESAGSHR